MGLVFCDYLFVVLFLSGGEWGENCKEINSDFPIRFQTFK